jgi:hypothetical protein
MTEYTRPYKWKAGPPTTKLSAEELTAQGYVKTSNAYGLVARIDRPDWIEFLARHYHRAPADFCVVSAEGLVPAPNWGAHYLRFSKDEHTVPYDVMRKMPSAGSGAKYVELPRDVHPVVFNDTIRPMTAGEVHSWYGLGKWPCCGGSEYIRGPSGGASVNVECPSCGMRLNILDSHTPPTMRDWSACVGLGQVIRTTSNYVPPTDPPKKVSFAEKMWANIRYFFNSEVR